MCVYIFHTAHVNSICFLLISLQYKYHGTKLKSLLKISSSSVSSHILSSDAEEGYAAASARPQDNFKHNYANDSQLQISTGGQGGDYAAEKRTEYSHSNEMPLEVNAVVSNDK